MRRPAAANGYAVESPRTLIHEPGIRSSELVLGRYRLAERLGAGGFGEVWRAHDQLLNREVAVKRVPIGPELDGDRALREAHASARLSHPAIVALYEACPGEDCLYLISELVDGATLAELIREDALEDQEVMEIGIALAQALEHAHSRGVVHRDIKPQNVLVPGSHSRTAGAAKLADFGGASLAGEDALTRTGDVLGTLAYMAPEQSEGREAREEADLYSLALVLYEALCGVNPVRGPTPAATARRIGARVESLGRVRRDLPRELTRAIDMALDPSPRRRGTLEDLCSALSHAMQQSQQHLRPHLRHAAPEDTITARALPASSTAPGAPMPARTGPGPRRILTRPAISSPALQPHAPPHALATAEPHPRDERHPHAERHPLPEQTPRLAFPRLLWLGLALAAVAWQLAAGRSGVALLLAGALAPLLLMPRRTGPGWLACALAPALGAVGLAGAFPALAGQPRRWRSRAALGMLGYWWTALAQPLLGQRLWLAPAAGMPARSAWEGSLSVCAQHVIGPLLTLGVLLGAMLWALAGVCLPWLVRGRSALADLLAAAAWSAAILLAAPALDAGLAAGASRAEPRGAVLGAILGCVAAVAARAVRGPVRPRDA